MLALLQKQGHLTPEDYVRIRTEMSRVKDALVRAAKELSA
jgi:hypothetical protein